MKSIHLEILTPEKVAFKEEVQMIVAPGAQGQIGILPGHIPLFTKLDEGEIKIVKNGEEKYLGIGSGFLTIAKDKAVILVTSAYHADELNEAELVEAKKRAERILKEKPQGEDYLTAQLQFRRSQIALKVLHRKRKPLTVS